MSLDVTERAKVERILLFRPCEDQKSLGEWIKHFLQIDFPDCIVDEDSNSSPLALIWEIYNQALYVNDPDFDRILSYANRGGGKTLSAAVLELLMVFHDERDVVHLASVEEQSSNCLEYVKKFLRQPFFSPFVTQNDSRGIAITRFRKDNEYLTPKEYASVPDLYKSAYREVINKIEIVVATPESVNGKHGTFCVDGETHIIVEDTRRSRKNRPAKFVFNTIAGLSLTGRKSSKPLTELDVRAPKKAIRVLTFNFEKGIYEPKLVTGGHRRAAQTVKVRTENGRELVCTPDHPIYVPGRGFLEASELVPGMLLFSLGKGGWGKGAFPTQAAPEALPAFIDAEVDEWEQVILGSLLGDGGCYKHSRSANAYFSERHCVEQANYLCWKREIVGRKVRTSDQKGAVSGYTGAPQVGFYTQNSHFFNIWLNFKKTLDGIERIGALGLAVWYMDDGYASQMAIASHNFTYEQNVKLAEVLGRKFGIYLVVSKENKEDGRSYFFLRGGVEAKRRLVDICRPYIHPEMAFKFDLDGNQRDCVICGQRFWMYELGVTYVCRQASCRSLKYGVAMLDKVQSVADAGERVVYDLTVEDNHNFFASRLLTHNCVYDELDLLDNETVWNEAQGIAKERDGKMPITYMTSTRKKMSGRVQDQIDRSSENGLRVRHWNLIDGARACEPDRHRPDLPRLKMYVDDIALKAISEEDFLGLREVERPKYTEVLAFSGCKGCKLLPACKTRLATYQKSTSSMLISLPSAQNSLTRGSLEFIKSQVLCRKPLSTGSIFNRFSRDRHVLTPAQIYERIEQSPAPKGFSKQHLIKYLKQMEGVKFWGGMDFGYTHLFVATILAQVGRDFYVLDCVAQAELETMECVELCQKEIGHYGASYYPDPENPALIKTFQKARFRMVDWAKKKGTVLGGIEAVRAKLHPGVNAEPELYFLGGDAGVEMLIQATEKWSWKLNPAGQPTETPKEEFKDFLDPIRYVIMNVAPLKGYRGARGAYGPRAPDPNSPKSVSKRFWEALRADGVVPSTIEEEPGQDPDAPRPRRKFYF